MKDDPKAMQRIHEAAAEALSDAAEFLLEEANRTAPLEEGTLIGSGLVTVDAKNLRATVSYDTPYAVRQHEDTRLRHDGGRRAKWLEHTAREQTRDITAFIRDRMAKAVR